MEGTQRVATIVWDFKRLKLKKCMTVPGPKFVSSKNTLRPGPETFGHGTPTFLRKADQNQVKLFEIIEFCQLQ